MTHSRQKSRSPLESLAVRSALVLALLFGLLFSVGLGVLWCLDQPLWAALLFAAVIVGGQYLFAPCLIDRLFRIEWVSSQRWGEEFAAWLPTACAELRIPVPQLGEIPDGHPNAFTYGRIKRDARVVVTTGLIDTLSPAELRAVVAHELEHVAHNDFIVMTVAQGVPLVLYILYTWTRNRSRDGAYALIVSLGAYAAYIASQFIVLSLSRVREFFADEGAGQVTRDPNALASALVKISYGMAPRADMFAYHEALQSKDKKQRSKAKAPRDLSSIATLGICNLEAGGAFAMSAADASGHFSPAQLQRVAQWDLKNPWAKWYELNSTHPLTVRRLAALSAQAVAQGQSASVQVLPDERVYRGQFWLEIFISSLPYALGLAGYCIGYLLLDAGGAKSWSPALGAYGLGLLIKTIMVYPHGESRERKVADLVGDELEASGVHGVPCEVEGEVVGRGVPGLFWSKDLVLRDDSGFIRLQYSQPFWIAEFLFAALKAKRFMGQRVHVKGWYRRAPQPYIEIDHLLWQENGLAHSLRCFFLHGTLFWSLFFLVLGGWATMQSIDIVSALWNAVLFLWHLYSHH
ncbi:protease HtpX [Abditibacteriota bacterium]|nr:protease HtpX [Abditibacteriota bacterium]